MPVTYKDVERAKAILVVGLDAENELPILHLRIRKAAAKGAKVFVVHPRRTRLWDVATHIPWLPGGERDLRQRLAAAEEGSDLATLQAALAEAGPDAVILMGPRLVGSAGAVAAVAEMAGDMGAKLALLCRRANDRGALRAGLHPALLPGGRQVDEDGQRAAVEATWGAGLPAEPGRDSTGILQAAADRQLEVLFLVGVDPLRDFPDTSLARRALENVPYKVVVDISADAMAIYADAMLPAAPFLEKDGHYTDWEGRAQRFRPLRNPSGLARSEWEIFQELSEAVGADMGFHSLDALHEEMAVVLAGDGAAVDAATPARSPSARSRGAPGGYAPPSAATVRTSALTRLSSATERRLIDVERALALGHSVDAVAAVSGIDPWFVDQIASVAEQAEVLRGKELSEVTFEDLWEAKRAGLSDRRIARLTGSTDAEVRACRRTLRVVPVFKTVDTCAGEFSARTPYYYSAYEEESEVRPGVRPRVVILGAGPNRIGQGIEFDYACVHAAFALRQAGFETVMVNSNPETVSTDYDTSDRLYFEPLALEDVLAVCEAECPVGVIVQLGGQTPLAMAADLLREGVEVLGTAPADLDVAEDRSKFSALLQSLRIPSPPHGVAASAEEAREAADSIGYPLLVRPSYVLGGRAMEIVYSEEELDGFVASATAASPRHPLFMDRFLEGAIEVDVDAVADGEDVLIGAVMEHIEEAGIHSGDSSCVIPPPTLSDRELDVIEETVSRLARSLRVRGLLNVQLAVRDEVAFVLEANPRASRTVPFVGKATGVLLAKAAARVMAGTPLADLRIEGLVPEHSGYRRLPHVAVKSAVLPFGRFPGVDTVLGPEMRSTGEVMGIDSDLGPALAKAQEATGASLPASGTVFISVADRDKRDILLPSMRLAELGFTILATRGTASALARSGVAVSTLWKRSEGSPNAAELIAEGRVDLVINTPFGRGPRTDGYFIRTAAASRGVPCITTIPGILAAVQGIEALRRGARMPRPLQEYHAAKPITVLPEVIVDEDAPSEKTLVAVDSKEIG
jgi:carbamoylphosphate synthase large subunit